ncbi:MAG: aldose epimerase family protein [Butyribacter sp.]|nr:galactose mutarotase [bacterium]MDY3854023.1 aldose epimerase family protein [Butyribacter sp.]
MSIKREKFGVNKDGQTVTKYTLINRNGMSVTLLDIGAVIYEIMAPDREGVFENIVLGFDTVADYEVNEPAFGAVLGRCANRISDGGFTLNGKEYRLEQNDGTNCLHGGTNRYEHLMYQAECEEGLEESSVSFSRLSADMEQGFPGNLMVTVTYTLNDANELMIEYNAVSDADTVVNMTNHCYFNIGKGGHRCKNVLEQELQVFADTYNPTNKLHLPTGEIRPVEGTAMDFRTMHRIGERVGEPQPDDSVVAGYDHNFILHHEENEITKAVVYCDRDSGRVIEVFTDCPGVQIYSAAPLDEPNGREGMHYGSSNAICFETQQFPNAINMPQFPSPVLKAGETYQTVTVFRFDILEEA